MTRSADTPIETRQHPGSEAMLSLAGLMAGFGLIAGNLRPSLDWLFYPGLLLAVLLCYLARPSRWLAYALLLPYFVLIGLAVWLPVFPWFSGLVLALLLAELAGRVLFLLLRRLGNVPWRFLVWPGFLFLFDFIFRQVPLLNRINLVSLLAPVYQQNLVLVLAAVCGGSLTVFILAAVPAALTDLAWRLFQKTQARLPRSLWLPVATLLICGLLIGSAYVWRHTGTTTMPGSQQTVRIAVVQGTYQVSFPVRTADDLARLHTARLSHYLNLAAQVEADLFVFPETEFGLWDRQNRIDQGYRDAFQQAAEQLDGLLLLCVTEGDSLTQSKADRTFSAILLDSRLVYGLTAKRNLVPFGETSRYSAGTKYDVYTTPAGRFGVSICYDMQGPTVERLKQKGAEMVLAPFNDSSFGTVYHHVHRTDAAIRAAECAVPIALANEDGISQLVDARGRVLQELGYREQGALVADMRLSDRFSPYLAFGRYLAAAVAAALMIGLLCLPGLRLVRFIRCKRSVT